MRFEYMITSSERFAFGLEMSVISGELADMVDISIAVFVGVVNLDLDLSLDSDSELDLDLDLDGIATNKARIQHKQLSSCKTSESLESLESLNSSRHFCTFALTLLDSGGVFLMIENS